MDSKDLTRNQGMKVFEETKAMMSRLHALTARMQQLDFPADDPVYVATEAAWRAVIVMNRQWQIVGLGESYSMRRQQPPEAAGET